VVLNRRVSPWKATGHPFPRPKRPLITVSIVLIVGSTGGIGRFVVDEALHQGNQVRALVRDPQRAGEILPAQAATAVWS